MIRFQKRHSVLPGFGLTLGFSLFYLCLVVLIPLAALALKAASFGWDAIWQATTTPRALASYRLTFGASLAAALVNAVFGFVVAWVLVRYRFPGRRVVDALVDLPFALPTAVAGIALTSLYAETGWLGRPLASLGLKVAFTPIGVGVALTFIGLPFVVRCSKLSTRRWRRRPRAWGRAGPRPSCASSFLRSLPPGSRAARSRSPAPSASTARSSSSPGTCR